MKVGKLVVLAVSLALSLSAFADDGTMGSDGGRSSGLMGSGSRSESTDGDGVIGSGTRTGYAGPGAGITSEDSGGGTLGSGTRSESGGGTIGSGTLASDDGDDTGNMGSGCCRAEEERGGLIGSGTRGFIGSGYATIVSDEFGGEYLVVNDGVTLTVVPLN